MPCVHPNIADRQEDPADVRAEREAEVALTSSRRREATRIAFEAARRLAEVPTARSEAQVAEAILHRDRAEVRNQAYYPGKKLKEAVYVVAVHLGYAHPINLLLNDLSFLS